MLWPSEYVLMAPGEIAKDIQVALPKTLKSGHQVEVLSTQSVTLRIYGNLAKTYPLCIILCRNPHCIDGAIPIPGT